MSSAEPLPDINLFSVIATLDNVVHEYKEIKQKDPLTDICLFEYRGASSRNFEEEVEQAIHQILHDPKLMKYFNIVNLTKEFFLLKKGMIGVVYSH